MKIFILTIWIVFNAFAGLNPKTTYAISCSEFPMPIITSTTEGGLDVKQGESVQVGLKNTSDYKYTFYIHMSRGNAPEGWVKKLGPQILEPRSTTVKTVSTTPTTILGTHYLRITVFHYNPDCRVGSKDFSFNVISGSSGGTGTGGGGTGGGGTGGGGTGGGGTGGGTLPERYTFNIPRGSNLENLEDIGGGNWIVGLLIRIVAWLLQLAGILALLATIYSGIMYISTSGSQEQAEKAKRNLTWAVIGIVIILLSYLIVEWIARILQRGTT